MFSKRLQTRGVAPNLNDLEERSKRSQTRCVAPNSESSTADVSADDTSPVSTTTQPVESPASSPSQFADVEARPKRDLEQLMAAEAARHKDQLTLMARIAPSPAPVDNSLADLATAESSRAQAMLAMLRPAPPQPQAPGDSSLADLAAAESSRAQAMLAMLRPEPPTPHGIADAVPGAVTSPALSSQDLRANPERDAPNGAAALRSQRFQVVHDQCVVRSEPAMTSRAQGVRRRGEFVTGVEETFDGWVRLAGQAGWMLRDMQGKSGLGVLLESEGRPQRLAVPRLMTDSGNQMFKVVCKGGVEIRSEPSEHASVVGSRAFGEFVFAETQSYHGWLRLVESVGWMTCFSVEQGEMLQHFDVEGGEEHEGDAQPTHTDTAPPTVFDEVLRRESPVDIVHEDELCLAFHDIDPQAPVHVLVIPKKRDGLTQLSRARDDQKALLGHLMLVAGRLGASLCAEGFRVVVNDGENGAQSIYHLHVHVLGGRSLAWPPG